MATAAAVGHGHPPTTTGLDHRKVAIWAFIGSECMLFTSLISTYLVYKGRSVTGPFPHEVCNPPQCATTMQPILDIPVTSMSTFVLLMSSLFMVLMFASLLLMHVGRRQLSIALVIAFALLMVLSLYSWLLTPLEDEH